MRRTFSAESVTQRKQTQTEVGEEPLQHQLQDTDYENDSDVAQRLILDVNANLKSKSGAVGDQSISINEVSSFRSSSNHDTNDRDDTLSEGISDLFSNDDLDSVYSTVADSKMNREKRGQLDDHNYLGLEDVLDDTADFALIDDDVRVKSNTELREEGKVDSSAFSSIEGIASSVSLIPSSPIITHKKKNQDILTSSSTVKPKKYQRNQITSQSNTITPSAVPNARRGRRHSSFIPNNDEKLPFSFITSTITTTTMTTTTFFDLPMNSLEVLEIFGHSPLKSPQKKLQQTKHHFYYNLPQQQNYHHHQNNINTPNEPKLTNEEEQIVDNNTQGDTSINKKDMMKAGEASKVDTNNLSSKPSRLRRRSTYPEHIFLSNQPKMNEMKEKLSKQIKEQFEKE